MVDYLVQWAVCGIDDLEDTCVFLESIGIDLWGLDAEEIQSFLCDLVFDGCGIWGQSGSSGAKHRYESHSWKSGWIPSDSWDSSAWGSSSFNTTITRSESWVAGRTRTVIWERTFDD